MRRQRLGEQLTGRISTAQREVLQDVARRYGLPSESEALRFLIDLGGELLRNDLTIGKILAVALPRVRDGRVRDLLGQDAKGPTEEPAEAAAPHTK